jgi:hypothetical protein
METPDRITQPTVPEKVLMRTHPGRQPSMRTRWPEVSTVTMP